MSADSHRKAIVKLLQAGGYRHHLWDVFSDCVEMMALAIANAVPHDLDLACTREERYLSIARRYERAEIERFPQILAELTMALEQGPDDVLGRVFGELDLGNAARGQFFTPYEVCALMARLTLDESADAAIKDKGFITVSEPACGAGAMIIAMADALRDRGHSYQQCMHVTAVDVDPRAVHMAYVQLSLLHIPAVIVLGNTLTLEEREHWYTPAHVLGFWSNKLRRGRTLDLTDAVVEQALPDLPASVTADIQLSLFA